MVIPDVYDNSRKFIFSNWTDEDFIGQWGGVQTVIPKGETKELEMFLAYHFTKHLVDRELNKQGKEASIGVPEIRHDLEIKTIAELKAGMDSPALTTLKEKIKAEVLEAESKKTKTKKIKEEPLKEAEFEGIN